MPVKKYYDSTVYIKMDGEWTYPSICPLFFDDEDVLEIDELPFGEILSIDSNDIFCILTPDLQISSKLKVSFEIESDYQSILIGIGSPSAFTNGRFFAHTDQLTGKWRYELDYDHKYVKAWEVSGLDHLLWDARKDPGQYRISLYNDSNEQIVLEVLIEELIQKPHLRLKGSSYLENDNRHVIEREVLIWPKIPNSCSYCGGSLNPQNLEWASYNIIICPNCGHSITVEFKRI